MPPKTDPAMARLRAKDARERLKLEREKQRLEKEKEKKRSTLASMVGEKLESRERALSGKEVKKEKLLREGVEKEVRAKEREAVARVSVRKGMPEGITEKVMEYVPKPGKGNKAWMEHVRQVRKDNPTLPFKEALRKASETYNVKDMIDFAEWGSGKKKR